jgi:hypothetical protein
MDENEVDQDVAADDPDRGSKRYTRLPERIKVEDTVESTDTRVARDPEAGRDTDRDFMIRYSGG